MITETIVSTLESSGTNTESKHFWHPEAFTEAWT